MIIEPRMRGFICLTAHPEGAAQNVRRSWCRDAIKRCQMLDRRMKSERGMDSEGELKLFLVELAGAK